MSMHAVPTSALITLATILFSAFTQPVIIAATVKLAWNASAGPEVAGYVGHDR